jgi:hypothetical protein
VIADTLYAYDTMGATVSLFTLDGKYVRRTTLPVTTLNNFFRFTDGRWAVIGDALDRKDQSPIQVLKPDGTVMRSFGARRGAPSPGPKQEQLSGGAQTSRSSIWAIARFPYRIEEWSSEGQLLRTIDRDADWFPVRAAREEANRAPEPILAAVHEDRAGKLWTLAVTPDPRWKGPIFGKTDSSGGKPLPPNWNEIFDSVIEVIDPSNGQLLASRRFSERLYAFPTMDLLYSIREDENGERSIDVWRRTLKR